MKKNVVNILVFVFTLITFFVPEFLTDTSAAELLEHIDEVIQSPNPSNEEILSCSCDKTILTLRSQTKGVMLSGAVMMLVFLFIACITIALDYVRVSNNQQIQVSQIMTSEGRILMNIQLAISGLSILMLIFWLFIFSV